MSDDWRHLVWLLCFAGTAVGCGTPVPPPPSPPAPPTASQPAPQPAGQRRMVCALRGRLLSFNAAYANPAADKPLFGLFGAQLVDKVFPPRSFGGRVWATLRWPVVGPFWLDSDRVFSLATPLEIPEMGLTVRAHRYLEATRQLDDGRVALRIDLGKDARPRQLERVVSCNQLTLGRFEPLKLVSKDAPADKRPRAVFSTGSDPVPVALSLAPGAKPVVTLGLYSARVVSQEAGWLQVRGTLGTVRYAGWIPATTPRQRSQGPPGMFGLGGLMGSALPAAFTWSVTAKLLPLRLVADPRAPVIATLAPGVKVRELRRENGFVWIAAGPVRRSSTPRLDDPANIGFAATEAELVVAPPKAPAKPGRPQQRPPAQSE